MSVPSRNTVPLTAECGSLPHVRVITIGKTSPALALLPICAWAPTGPRQNLDAFSDAYAGSPTTVDLRCVVLRQCVNDGASDCWCHIDLESFCFCALR